jgi:hypothetical protein
VKIIKNVNNIIIFFFLVLSSIFISYTYYFDHFGIVNALILNSDEIYKDKTNLFFLIYSNSPSFLFFIINFFIKIGFSTNFINILLTFIATLLNLSGIYLISKFITSSIFLGILISITTIVLTKNFGDIDYPTLMFSWHTVGLFAYSLSTFILGLLTLRNLLFAILTCLLLLSIHLVIGIWMFGIIILSSYFFIEKINIKKIGITIFFLLIVVLFYVHWFTNYAADIPFEFNQKDYDDYFFYIEAHRNNFGDLGNLYFDYVLKSLILLTLMLFYLKFSFSNITNNNNFFLKTLSISIIFSGIIYFVYKIFPQIFPEIAIRTIPQRFFLIHSVVGYPIIISIIYKFLENFFIYKKFNKNFLFQFITIVIILHLIQQHYIIKIRFNNIKIINEDKIKEHLFWKKVKDLELNEYVLTSNDLCNKTIIYTNFPILFCFHSLDYIPYFPKLASPTKRMTDKVLGISYDDLEYKNSGGISDIEIKKIYENKSFTEWNILKKELNFNTIIVPKEWNLNLNLIIDDKYKVYKIE